LVHDCVGQQLCWIEVGHREALTPFVTDWHLKPPAAAFAEEKQRHAWGMIQEAKKKQISW
jgi:hypothetical protein